MTNEEMAMIHFKILFQHLPECTKENHKSAVRMLILVDCVCGLHSREWIKVGW
jgi:hypothetical protein